MDNRQTEMEDQHYRILQTVKRPGNVKLNMWLNSPRTTEFKEHHEITGNMNLCRVFSKLIKLFNTKTVLMW